MKINSNFSGISLEGGLYDIFNKTLLLEQAGKKIIHMEIGKPDFDSPPAAKEAAKKALDEGFVHYTSMIGIPELRHAIAKKEKLSNGTVFDPDKEIIITAGACEAITCALIVLFEPGDEIIVPSPYFPVYYESAVMLGLNIVEFPLSIDNDFEIDTDNLRAAVTDRTRGIIINTPSNPTGKIISLESLNEVANIARQKDLIVISDETYDQFTFSGAHYSIRNLNDMQDRTIVINSASKTFSMTGWRIGYLIAPARYIPYLSKAHQSFSTCATSFAQKGAAVAFNDCQDFTKEMVKEFKARRDLLIDGLSKLEGIECNKPEGAFYLFPRISKLGISAVEFCDLLLDHGLAIAPGSAFGRSSADYVRMSYACSQEDLREAIDIIGRVIDKL